MRRIDVLLEEPSTCEIFTTFLAPFRGTMAVFVATLLLLLTSPPSTALEAEQPQIRPQGKSSEEILNGKQNIFVTHS